MDPTYDPTGLKTLLWWKASEPGRAMISVAKALEGGGDHNARRRQNLRHMRLYANRDLSSIYECGVAVSTYDAGIWLTMNIVQSCVDTLAAKLWKTPRIQASVQGGDWSLKQRAKRMTRFGDGLWYMNKWAGESRLWGVDSTLFGAGVVHVHDDDVDDEDGEIIIDRFLLDELIWDETEAVGGLKTLKSIFRKRWVHREILMDKWLTAGNPDRTTREARKVAIQMAPGANPRQYWASTAGDMIALYEGFHIGSQGDGSDGMRIVGIEGHSEAATFVKAPWTRKRFPFSLLNWNKLATGLVGKSLAEELVPIQLKINDLLETIDAGQNMMCVPKVFVKQNMLDMATWTNAFAELITVNTAGPIQDAVYITNPKGVSEELYREREFWWRHAFEVTGISMLSATAEKPQGIGSAVALRELLDREDMRLTPKGKTWEETNVDVFECCMDAGDELAQRNRKVRVQVPRDKNIVDLVEYGEVKLDRKKAIIRSDAVSALPSTPQGRKQYAVELWQLGAVNREQFLQMLELPDTTSTMNLILASIDNAERAIEIMLETDKYEPPEEFADLVLARTMVMQAYLRERNEGAPERVLENLRRYIEECTFLLSANDNGAGAAQAQAAAQQAPGAAPAAALPVPVGTPPVEQPAGPAQPGELQPAPATMLAAPAA